jgi:hypothetical protein
MQIPRQKRETGLACEWSEGCCIEDSLVVEKERESYKMQKVLRKRTKKIVKVALRQCSLDIELVTQTSIIGRSARNAESGTREL